MLSLGMPWFHYLIKYFTNKIVIDSKKKKKVINLLSSPHFANIENIKR